MVRFGPFALDPERGELEKDGRPLRLPRQPTKLLALLVSRAGRIVTREEIQHALWEDDTFADFDQGINFCIKRIREALDDDPREASFRRNGAEARVPLRRRPRRRFRGEDWEKLLAMGRRRGGEKSKCRLGSGLSVMTRAKNSRASIFQDA